MPKVTYKSLGYNGFLEKPLSTTTTQKMSPTQASASLPSDVLYERAGVIATFTTDIVFSSTDYNTAAWAAGNINFTDGTVSEDISSGNTGDMTAATYIYYDKSQRGTLQTTTSPKDAVGENVTLLAIAEDTTSGKSCKITPVFASGLTVSELTADQITASTITSAEISGDQLDVIAADTGTLNVDEYITLGSDSNVKIDGANKQIIINDGSNDRILIGYQLGGF